MIQSVEFAKRHCCRGECSAVRRHTILEVRGGREGANLADCPGDCCSCLHAVVVRESFLVLVRRPSESFALSG
jgi:hypothetical protein